MGTSFGTCEAFDNCANQSRTGAELKRAYIEQGMLYDDLADNAWGGIYEGSGLYGHQEELILFDHRDPRHRSGVAAYGIEAAEVMRDEHYGVGLGAFMLDAAARDGIFGPATYDYPSWQKKIKETPGSGRPRGRHASTPPDLGRPRRWQLVPRLPGLEIHRNWQSYPDPHWAAWKCSAIALSSNALAAPCRSRRR